MSSITQTYLPEFIDLEQALKVISYDVCKSENILRKLGAQIQLILKSILNDSYLCEKVASNSYMHQNGFFKSVLHSSQEDGWALRLHVWENVDISKYDSNIHNHRWNYGSLVLSGSFLEEQYIQSITGIGLHEFQYFTDKKNQSYYIKEHDIRCKVNKRNIYYKDKFYCQKSNIFHKVLPLNEYCSTLVLQGIPSKDSSTILSDNSNLNLSNGEIEKRFLSPQQLEEIFLKYIPFLRNE